MRLGIAKLFGIGAMLIADAAFAVNAPPQYVLTDLGTLTGQHGYSMAYGLNNLGQVVGESTDSQGNPRPFLYSNGVMQDLGSLGGVRGAANGINDAGQIVGWSDTSTNPDVANWHAFTINSTGGPMQDTGLSAVVGYHRQYSINNSGQIAGPNGYSSVIYSNGQVQHTIKYPDQMNTQQTFATAINDAGQVVGWAYDIGTHRAFVYDSPGGFHLLPSSPNIGDNYSSASGINNLGEIVGDANRSYYDDAFLYSAGSWEDLGELKPPYQSQADAINVLHQIVGLALTGPGGPQIAMLDSGGTMYDLGKLVVNLPPGWGLGEATAINDQGQIVGIMGDGTDSHAFLLTPTPEPGAASMFCVAAFALLARVPRRRYSSVRHG